MSLMSCSELWLDGLVSTKLNVWLKKTINSFQVVIPLCNAAYTYHDHDVSSNVWTKSWTHSLFGCDSHKVWHSIGWSLGLLCPLYLPMWYSSTFATWTIIILWHRDHSLIEFLCVTHQRAGVAFIASSNSNNCCAYDTLYSNSTRNSDNFGCPSYTGNSIVLVVTQHND